MDFSRLRSGELLAGLGGIALIGVMFLDWFGITIGAAPDLPTGIPGAVGAPTTGVNAWDSLDFIDYVLLLTGLVGIKAAGIRAWGKRPNGPLPMGAIVCALGGISASLIIWRIFDPPANGDLKTGIFLGLVAAALLGLGGYIASRADGFDFYPDDTGSGRASARRSTSRKR